MSAKSDPCAAVLRALQLCLPPPPDTPAADAPPPTTPPKKARTTTVPKATVVGVGAKRSHLERELQRERQAVRSAILGLVLCAWSLTTEPPLNVTLLVIATVLFAATVARRQSTPSSSTKRTWTTGSARFYGGSPRSPRRVSMDLDTTQFPAALEMIETQGLATGSSGTRWSLASCGSSSSPNKKKKLDSEVRRPSDRTRAQWLRARTVRVASHADCDP